MKSLVAVDAARIAEVTAALRTALSNDGPALFPSAGPSAVSAGAPWPAVVPQRVAVVLETSGSSGSPKRVALSANALLSSAAATESALGGPGGWVLALPVYYIAGLQVLVRSIAAAIDPVLLPSRSFRAADFLAALDSLEPGVRRYTALVPAQLHRLLTAAEQSLTAAAKLRSLDAILVGGQRLPEPSLRRAADLGLAVVRSYGATETSGGCVYDGVPLGTVTVRTREGQVEVSGPVLAEGYLDDPAATAAAFSTDESGRWYRTRDAGTFDGVLHVTGRVDDVLISGGVKVSLAAVESVLRAEPGLTEAVVISVPDVQWGEVPIVVVAGSSSPPTLEQLRRLLTERLGPAAAPARLVCLEHLPTLLSGKPDRRAIRDLVCS